MRCGITLFEFWELTPAETFTIIEAAIWQDDRTQKQLITQAWLTANLTRAKRLPSLASLLVGKAKKISGPELQKRRQEFKDMTKNVDLSKIQVPK